MAQPAGGGAGEGFHGYPWGTSPETIPLLAAADSADRPGEGVHAYGATLRFLGMPTRAVFYFDSADGGLVGGKYLSEPPDLSCVAQFRTVRLLVGSDLGEASLELSEGAGSGAPSAREACRRFLEAPTAERWEASFVGPARSDTVARVRLLRRDGEPGLVACVRILSDCRWPDEAGIPEGPDLGPARRDTAGAQSE